MESWHPMWIILLTALSGVFIYGYLWVLYASDTLLKVLTILTLPPMLAFYPSINAIRGYFKEKRIRRLVAVAVFLGLLVSLPFATRALDVSISPGASLERSLT